MCTIKIENEIWKETKWYLTDPGICLFIGMPHLQPMSWLIGEANGIANVQNIYLVLSGFQ